MKVCLINPKNDLMANVPNVGLGYIASALREQGHEVTVLDHNLTRQERFVACDVLGISFTTAVLPEAERLTELYRRFDLKRKTKIVWGGVHPTVSPDSELPDFIVRGEGEHFVDYLDERVVNLGLHQDLDSLPFPDYTMFDSWPVIRRLVYPLVTGRGCPYRCSFCAVSQISGRKVRVRSVDNCIAEVKRAIGLGFGKVDIIDDCFTFHLDRAKQFAREMAKLGIRYGCPNGIRADCFDDELARLMKISGGDSLSFGIESACPEVFARIGKGETLEQIEDAIGMAQREGIAVNATFIIGIPGSNFTRDIESAIWARRHNIHANFGFLVPWPGTRVRDEVKFIGDVSPIHFGQHAYPVFELDGYSREEMVDAYVICNHISASTWHLEWYRGWNLHDMVADMNMRVWRHEKELKETGALTYLQGTRVIYPQSLFSRGNIVKGSYHPHD